MILKFHSEARKEFFETAEYYEEQLVGLGDDFIDEVEKVLDVIKQQPASGSKSRILKGDSWFLAFLMELFILLKQIKL